MEKFDDVILDVEGVKFYSDGWIGPRTCAMSHSFADEKDNEGILFLDSTTLARRMEPFAVRGWTIATHAIGDRAIENVLDAYEKVFGSDIGKAAARIEHCSIVSSALIDRIAQMGVVVCLQPSFASSDSSKLNDALGERAVDAYRWREFVTKEVHLLSGSDFPIETQNPMQGLHDLTKGRVISEDSLLEIPDALAIMTDEDAGTMTLSEDPNVANDLMQIEIVETKVNR
jgi:predicted amidohydrolase YtcJ